MHVEGDAGSATEARTRWFGLWDGYLLVTGGLTVVLLAASDGPPARRAAAIGAVVLAVPWYVAVGRPQILADVRGRRAAVFAAGLVLLFGVVVAADRAGTAALFPVAPLLVMSLPLAAAAPAVLAVHLWPLGVAWIREGTLTPEALGRLPTLLLGAAFATFAGLFVSRVLRQSRERSALIAQLESSREREAQLSREAGVAAERERLAREIHDTLAQSLTSITALAQAADAELDTDPARAREHVDLVRRVADESLAEARAFIAERTPPTLDGGSLAPAVRRQVETLAARTELEIECTVDGDEVPLPTAAAVVLLRSVQEALSNVRRHADARHVDVLVSFTPSTVGVLVADDGRGFDPGAATGFGLRGMRSRAAEVGGRADVRSGPDGTFVEVVVPVPPTEAPE